MSRLPPWLALVVLTSLWLTTPARACSCLEQHADVTFDGCVTGVERHPQNTWYTFRVEEDGPDFSAGETLRVRDSVGLSMMSSCAFGDFERGYRYEVGANEYDFGWGTGACTGTSAVEDPDGEPVPCEPGGCDLAGGGRASPALVALLSTLAALIAARRTT